MKNLIGKLFLFSAILIGAQTANAQFFGWSTTVTASNGTNILSQPVSGPSQFACETARTDAVNFLASLGYTMIISNPPCTPVAFRPFEDIRWIEEPKIKWPGPVCLSCPYLDLENIKVIFPDYYEKVAGLIKEYNVMEYNEQLMKLQDEFNLGGFEEEMFNLETQLNGMK